MTAHPELQDANDGVVLSLHVHPGAGVTAVVGRHGDALKVRVAAPPTGGRANDAVVALVAKSFGLASADVELVSGASSRQKRVRLGGLERDDAERLVDTLLANASDVPGSGDAARDSRRGR